MPKITVDLPNSHNARFADIAKFVDEVRSKSNVPDEDVVMDYLYYNMEYDVNVYQVNTDDDRNQLLTK